MKRQYTKLIVTVILLQMLFFAFAVPVQCQETTALSVSRTVWGPDLASPTKVHSGDEGVSLTIELQNLSNNSTIKGISGVLILADTPFIDIYGNSNATSTAKPSVGDLLSSTDEVAPKGFFTLTFNLDIKDAALPGVYPLDLVVSYSVYSWLIYTEGAPQTFHVNCVISPAETTVAVSASPTNLESGEPVKIGGSLQPAIENANISVVLQDANGNKTPLSVKTKIDGSFNLSYTPKVAGVWTVNASWLGDDTHKGNWASTTFEVKLSVSMAISLSNDRLRAGYDNTFNVTVKNDGAVALSALDLSFKVPPPLVNVGKSSWTINNLDANKNVSLSVVVYAPSASIGSTFSGSFTASCRDDYGESKTFSFDVGIVIVGNVELGVYDSVVKPNIAVNGSKVDITTTLLNRGTVPAVYVNASILPNKVLNLTSASAVYIGDVDENTQAPFTLTANVSKDAQAGMYPVTLRICYRDDQNLDHSFDYTFDLQVTAAAQSNISNNTFTGFFEVGLAVVIIAVAACLTILVYRKHVSGKKGQNR